MTKLTAGRAAVTLLLAVMAVLVLYPVVYSFFMAVMTPEEASMYPPRIVPHSLNVANFIEVFGIVPIAAFIGNTFLVSGAVMAGRLMTSVWPPTLLPTCALKAKA